jgi:glycosyltransferase involved in cell wall biosynthesis
MSQSPFFSILLPTKNRSHLVGYAIRSVLQQDLADFELIICDNDDDPDATQQVVEKYPDPRVKYIRTGGLDMIANWNSALDAATGQHVSVLEDKMIFYAGALAAIKALIEATASGIVVWRTDVIEDEGTNPMLIQQAPSEDAVLSSETVLQKVVSNVMANWTILPRGLCCSVPRTTIEVIVERTGQPFYEEVSPDFVSAIKLLGHIDEYTLAGSIFTLITSNKVSNGKRISRRKFKDYSYFMGNKKFELQLEDVYVKSQWIAVNSVIADYLRQRRVLGGRLKNFEVSHRHYFEMLFRDLIVYSLAEKKVLWDKQEIWQLFSGGDGLIRNVWYAAKSTFAHVSTRYFGQNKSAKGGLKKTVLTHEASKAFIDDCIATPEAGAH